MSGGPTGPMTYGRPDDFKAVTNPYDSSVQAPDQSKLRQAMMQRIDQNAGNNIQQSMASMQRSGVGGSQDPRALADVAQGQAQQVGQMEAGLGQQDFQNRMGVMDALNNARLQKYGIDSQNYNNEQGQRGQFWQSIAQIPGEALNIAGMGKLAGLWGGDDKKTNQGNANSYGPGY